MKRTSRSSRLVSKAARSPALAMTGPEVARKFTPSSRARICASVVLPSPGGPTNSTWSSASPRSRAARMKTSRLARACSWPTNSSSRCGRSDASARSSSRRSGDTMLRVGLTNPSFGAPTILVREQFGDGGNRGVGPVGDDHPRLRVVVADELAADAAGRDHLDALVLRVRLRMADGDDGVDALVTAFGDRAPDRDRL